MFSAHSRRIWNLDPNDGIRMDFNGDKITGPCRARYGYCATEFLTHGRNCFSSTINECRYEWELPRENGSERNRRIGAVFFDMLKPVLHFTERDGLRCFSIQTSILIVSNTERKHHSMFLASSFSTTFHFPICVCLLQCYSRQQLVLSRLSDIKS